MRRDVIAKATNDCDHDRRWSAYSQRDLAAALGRDPSTIALWVKQGLPRYTARQNRFRYCIPCAFHWLSGRGVLRTDPPLPLADELLDAGGDSPSLERWRKARAQLAEMELEERQRSLMPRDQVRSALGRIAAIWRQLGERLSKRHGPEAGESVRDAIGDSQRVIDEQFGRNGHSTAEPA